MVDFNEHNLWGIDLGGTKIEGIILQSSIDYQELLRLRVPTEAHIGYRHILDQVAALVAKMESIAGYKPANIGIGTPGVYVPGQGMKNCNATVVNGNDLKKDLEKLLTINLILANDANCFALAETKLGVVKHQYPDARVVFGIILGTGIGGGLVIDEKIIHGKHGIGGEWGHNYLYPGEGKVCYCGKQGCNEQIISGPALEAYYQNLSGLPLPLMKIHKRYRSGNDPFAEQTIARLYEGFAKALSVVINIVDPDIVVLGGGVSNIGSIYTETTGLLKEMIFNHEFETPLVKAKLGDSAGVFGSALLVANNKFFEILNKKNEERE